MLGLQPMTRVCLTIVLIAGGLWALISWSGVTVQESGQAFVVGDHQVIAQFGYSHGGDQVHYAVIRTWPKGATPEQKRLDPRMARSFLGWPLIRDNDGRMTAVGSDGHLYFFQGDTLKTMRMRMNEHDDTIPLGNAKTLDEMWVYLQRFRVDNGEGPKR
jgi:hypothetical protein